MLVPCSDGNTKSNILLECRLRVQNAKNCYTHNPDVDKASGHFADRPNAELETRRNIAHRQPRATGRHQDMKAGELVIAAPGTPGVKPTASSRFRRRWSERCCVRERGRPTTGAAALSAVPQRHDRRIAYLFSALAVLIAQR